MVPERVRTITTSSYEAVDTDQEFTLSELENVLHRLKDTAPGDDTVCYSMIKNAPLDTSHLLTRLIKQSFSEGRLPTRWKMDKIIPITKKDKTHRPISLLPAFSKVMEPDRKMNLLKVLNSLLDVNASILKNIYTATIQSTLEYGAVTFGMMTSSDIDRSQVSQNKTHPTRHKCQYDETQTSNVTRGTQSKAK